MRKVLLLLVVVIFAVGMAIAQSNAGSQSPATNPDQNQASQTTTSNQTSTTTTSDQNANQGAAANQSDQTANQRKGGRLPQTASPLPLLGLLGLGSLGVGVITRKRK